MLKKPSFPKKWSNTPPERFFAVSPKNTAFFEKIIYYENIKHLIFDKKGYIKFLKPLSPKLVKYPSLYSLPPAPQTVFSVSSENTAFFEKII